MIEVCRNSCSSLVDSGKKTILRAGHSFFNSRPVTWIRNHPYATAFCIGAVIAAPIIVESCNEVAEQVLANYQRRVDIYMKGASNALKRNMHEKKIMNDFREMFLECKKNLDLECFNIQLPGNWFMQYINKIAVNILLGFNINKSYDKLIDPYIQTANELIRHYEGQITQATKAVADAYKLKHTVELWRFPERFILSKDTQLGPANQLMITYFYLFAKEIIDHIKGKTSEIYGLVPYIQDIHSLSYLEEHCLAPEIIKGTDLVLA